MARIITTAWCSCCYREVLAERSEGPKGYVYTCVDCGRHCLPMDTDEHGRRVINR